MKEIITSILIVSILLLFACHSGGQAQKTYDIQFRSGNYAPSENIQAVALDPQRLSAALFNGYYYTVVQFYNLPDSSARKILAENGIRLLHYLPQFAYVSSIPVETKLDLLKDANARSIFVLTAKQKMTTELQKNQFPKWAIPQKGYVDLAVTGFESFDLGLLTKSITDLNGQVINVQKEFATVIVRLPQKNLASLAELPYVFWIDVIDEPAKPEKAQKIQEL